MIYLYTIIFCLIGYLMGSMIFGQFIAWANNKDMTTIGSTNPGATNVKRKFGFGVAFLVSFLDAFKGLIAVVICVGIYSVTIYKINSNHDLYCLVYLAGTFAVIGHCFPVHFVFGLLFNKFNYEKVRKYKGGKGVSTTGGVLFSVSPYLGLIAFLTWLIIVLITRYVSLGSLLCMLVATLFVFIPNVGMFYIFDHSLIFPNSYLDYSWYGAYTDELWLIIGTFILLMVNNIILVCKHRPNIIKLLNNQENKLF